MKVRAWNWKLKKACAIFFKISKQSVEISQTPILEAVTSKMTSFCSNDDFLAHPTPLTNRSFLFCTFDIYYFVSVKIYETPQRSKQKKLSIAEAILYIFISYLYGCKSDGSRSEGKIKSRDG